MVEYLPVLLGSIVLIVLIICLIGRIKQRNREFFLENYLEKNTDVSMSLAERIRISKRELETVFDALTELICIIDGDFKIVRVNKSYASFAGKPIKDILGKPCYKVLYNRDSVCPECSAIQSFKSGSIITKKKTVQKTPDEIIYFEISTFPVFNAEKVVIHVIEFMRNVTEEKRMLDQLIRSEKLASIGIMTAGIAHEMHNPLSGISGMALNLLEMPDKYGLNEKGISRINAILESSSRAITIMKDLLYISRKDDKTSVLTPINSLILKTLKTIHIPGNSEIHYRFNLEESLPPVNCDPAKIEQVIMNIGTNAIQSVLEKKRKLNEEGKQFSCLVMVSSQLQDLQNILITFSDNGTGIPEDIRSKIWDPFFSTKPAGEGTGLGLSISHKIVEEHGGRIFFEVIEDMTIFSVILPIERKCSTNQ